MGVLARNRKCTKMLTDRRTDRQTDRQTDGQTDRRTDRPGSNSLPRPRYAAGGGLKNESLEIILNSFLHSGNAFTWQIKTVINASHVTAGRTKTPLRKKVLTICYFFWAGSKHSRIMIIISHESLNVSWK